METEKNKADVYLKKFSRDIKPILNPIFSSFIFHLRNQKEGEAIESHMMVLKLLALDCDFGDSSDSSSTSMLMLKGLVISKIMKES